MSTSHVTMTVNGTKYRFIIRPESWAVVDIVDFSPRAVTGMPTRSELGLYLDVGQESFQHGYGYERFTQLGGYAWTGHLVDTSAGFACLFTEPSYLGYLDDIPDYPPSWCVHRDLLFIGTGSYLYGLRSNGNLQLITAIDSITSIVSNGSRMFIARRGVAGSPSKRMFVADAGIVSHSDSTHLYALVEPYWSTTPQVFANGRVYIYDGVGIGQIRNVTANTSNSLTISPAWNTNPAGGDRFIVFNDAGVAANPPYDFCKLALFGGYVWGAESYSPYLHFWSDTEGFSAEGNGNLDVNAVRVGPGEYLINNMIAFNNQLLVMREDGIWAIGDDNVAYHLLNFADEAHVNNFRAACVWNGFLYFTVRNKLYRYKSGLQDATPPYWDTRWPFKAFGDFSALVPRGKFLHVFGRANDTTTLESTEQNKFGVIIRTDDAASWHKIADIYQSGYDVKDIPLAFYDSADDYLYYGVRTSAHANRLYIYRVKFDPMSDLPHRSFPTSGDHNLYTSFYDLNMIPIPKSFARVTLDGDFPSGASVVVGYRVDDSTSFTTLGTITSAGQYLDFPPNTTGKRIQLRLNLKTTSSTNTPLIRAVVLKVMARPDVKYGATFDVIVEDNMFTPDQGASELSAKQIRRALMAARDSVAPITFTDIYGESHAAYLSSLRFMLHDYVNEQGEVVHTGEVARCTVVYV